MHACAVRGVTPFLLKRVPKVCRMACTSTVRPFVPFRYSRKPQVPVKDPDQPGGYGEDGGVWR